MWMQGTDVVKDQHVKLERQRVVFLGDLPNQSFCKKLLMYSIDFSSSGNVGLGQDMTENLIS